MIHNMTPKQTGTAELLYLAANRVESPEERDPGWLHMTAATDAGTHLAAWLRAEAASASIHAAPRAECVAFAEALLGRPGQP